MLNRTMILTAALSAVCLAGAIAPAAAQGAMPKPLLPLHVDVAQFSAVGTATFGGPASTQTVEGFAGQNLETVVLMARGNLALCSGLNITYASGTEEAYPLLAPGILNQEQIYKLEPAGAEAEIASISATCRAPGNGEVTLAFAGKAGPVFVPMRTEAAGGHGNAGGDD
jgi:hypothetical protein